MKKIAFAVVIAAIAASPAMAAKKKSKKTAAAPAMADADSASSNENSATLRQGLAADLPAELDACRSTWRVKDQEVQRRQSPASASSVGRLAARG